MKSVLVLGFATCVAGQSPVQKVVTLLSDLEAKITAQGVEAQKLHESFMAECHDNTKNLQFDIKTGNSEIASLKAAIAKASGTVEAMSNKVDGLISHIAGDNQDLESATAIRTKEKAEFLAAEKELLDAINTLQRAIVILEREMKKGGASMIQLQNAKNLIQALSVLVDASALSAADSDKLTAMLQSGSDDQDADAPAAAVYTSQSGGIVDVLTKLLQKAEEQLDAAKKAEITAAHNFALLKQSLEDEIKFETKDMADAKAQAASAAAAKASGEGSLSVSTSDLADDTKNLADLEHDCATRNADFEAAVASRAAELKALADAKKVIQDTTAGAGSLSYGFAQSFVQVSSQITSRAGLAQYEAVHLIRDLAKKLQSDALAQLASRLTATVSISSGDDVFAKVKGLIAGMISKLEAIAGADAQKKAYCDKEMAESNAKSADNKAAIAKLTAAIDLESSQSKRLKEEVAALQGELAAIASAQAKATTLRNKEHADFVANKAELEKGLQGVKTALNILGEYYSNADKAHEAAEGAGTGIIGLLEVVESDFSKGLVEATASESSAAAEYDTETKDNAVATTSKTASVKYKNKRAAALDKSVTELSSDLAGEKSQLAAVSEYLASLDKQCIVQPLSYAERSSRRAAEIAGLKQALGILENETAFLQKSSRKAFLKKGVLEMH